jgi:FMN reductase (NADPH)
VAVTQAEKRARLAELCGNQAHVAEAPLLLVWCADLYRLERVCKLRGCTQVAGLVENFLVAVVDVSIAAQNAALAAESMGLGICYIGSIRNHAREVIEMLKLPRLVYPITGLTVGWPMHAPSIRPRLPQQAVLHWEEYNLDQEAALREYDAEMIATRTYEDRQIPAPGKPGEMEAYGWLEHTARRVSKEWRTEQRQVLEEQGFSLR